MDLKNLTIEKASEMMREGKLTSVELVSAYLKNIEEKNKDLNAYLEVFDDCLDQAKKADEIIKNKKGNKLTGIPIAIKDNILIKGKKVTAASKILENYVASYDAFVIKKLREEGAVFIGRTNMDEFAMGSSTQTSAYGVTKNPYNGGEYVPGGSSGGSAAAVASDMALCALGTETCGSVRQPASFCGLVGLKPTYGAVSRNGIIAMGNSLDQVSPFGKSVEDARILFDAIVGKDDLDSTSVNFINKENMIGGKIGIPWHLFQDGVDEEVISNFKESVEKLKKAGFEIVDIELPYSKYSLATYYIIMPAEVSTNLSRFDGVRYGLRKEGSDVNDSYKKTRSAGFGAETRRRIILGTYVLSHGYYDAYYNKAWKVRHAIEKEFEKTFQNVDFIMTPTTPTPAFKIGEKLNDPVAMYLCDIFSAPANIAGIPAIALPSGFTKNGLPLSIQFMANHFHEKDLFQIGKKFEGIK
ncbi:MAG TPA: Asp-tRNA(Asn)/Glu-tRNA(Gln) amidotransferase subunit GatA [Candidatus Paceibacterota bacterium]|nr:Asp-tRNA(Asn)/Glu-tRNA(Gln) amidotransferase subunit GatA [Candidatus Paceibacterota bacterium]HPT17949.1 Asp-tRNA(Asn)/Glu-tRNA(Gln) amidotransferase subunit GatA [Candidatus Paceibacterota bacterium]